MALNTDFNVSPYYDDYNEDKNFHRVLFRPAVPIQARELTQLQTILQNQVERFGDNIYKQGTIIKGCGLTFDFNYTYVKINDLQVDGQSTLVSNYANGYVQDSAGLNSEIVNYVQGLESQNPDLSTLFVKYINTGTGDKKAYANGDVLTVYARDYSIQSITISAAGTLYSNSDTIVFTSANGTGASANLVTYANGSIRNVVISDGGSGYLTAPTLSITTSTGSAGALTALNYIGQVRVANSSFTAPVGTGSAVTVGDGIVYQKGHFVRVEQQTTILDKYTNQPSDISAGFLTSESIVNNSVDSTLLDNAQGYSNYTAPGAHRLKLTPSLVVLSLANAASNNQFLSIIEFQDGRLTRRRTDTEFNSIGSELARRTLEESGNYVVNPFNIYTEEKASNTTHLNLSVSSGLGYVNGIRTELSSTIRVPLRKGTDTTTSNNQTISTNYGNYVLVNELLGNFDFSAGATVYLRDTSGTDTTDNFGGAPTTPGSIIGTASIRSFVYDSGAIGTPSCLYRIYLFNVSMQAGQTFKSVRSVQISGGIADTVLEGGVSVLKETTYDQLIFSSGASAVQLFNNEQFIYRQVSSASILSTGIATVTLTGTGEEFPYTASSTLNDTQEKEFIVIPTANAHSTTNLSGTVTSSGNVVTGTSTSFITQLNVGDYVKFSGNTTYFRISSITNATSMSVNGTTGPAVSSNTLSYAFPKNIPIRLDRGTANVSIDSNGNTASVYIGNTISGTTSATIYSNVKVDGASPKLKTVTKDVYVKLSTDRISANTNGPWCIGVPDAFKLVGVYIGSSNTYSNTTANYASSFELITGQNDNFYGLSYIRKKPGSTIPVTATNSLLVRVNTFTHGTGYYLSTESYPVDDATTPLPSNKIRTEDIPYYLSPKTGKYFNLRDTVDFRPIVANTANAATTVAGASTDPLSTEALTGTLYFPTPNEDFQADITHYLRRIDTIVMAPAGTVRIVEGVSDNNPVPPKPTDGTMKLGTIFVPPYPSLSPKSASDSQRHEYSTLIKQDQVKGYTMKDIKQLEDRINRIEYYSLLNTLEKSTTDLIIPSEANSSINRFKNGFFAEGFSSYDISNVNDPEYRIYIDTKSTVARPQIDKQIINLVANTSASSNVTFKGEYALIDYSESVLINQNIANKVRNPTQLMWKFGGTAHLYPKYDNYYDVTKGSVNVTVDLATPLNSLAQSINDSVQFKTDSQQVSVSASAYSTVTAATQQAAGLDQRTVTTTTTKNKGSVVSGGTNIDTQQVGEFLTDFGMNAYIRAQWITFIVTGLRPGTTHYAFFDKIEVTAYARPATINSIETMDPRGIMYEPSAKFTGAMGTPLVTDSKGILIGALYIPGETFFVGERSVIFSDNQDLNSIETSVSNATTSFNAYNFSKSSSSVSLSTKAPTAYTQFTSTEVSAVPVIENRVTARLPTPAPATGGSTGFTCCFIAGTKITMADGSTKNIEDVQLGDKLVGKDESINTVLDFIRPKLGNRTLISINRSVPFMTNDHPVYMKDGTWKSFNPEATKNKYIALSTWEIGKLEVGDVIETYNGAGLEVQTISEHSGDADLQVYNFTLDGNNTYLANDLVVHNKGGGCCCFVRGTSISLANGTFTNIEDVQIGDVLLGQDGAHNKVVEFLRPTLGATGASLIAFNGGKPFMTSDHPVYVKDGGWKSFDPDMTHSKYSMTVTKYNIGDVIDTPDGIGLEIKSIEEYTDQDQDQVIYNFKLDGNHTYVADGLVVHNKDPLSQTFSVDKEDGADGVYLTKTDLFFKQKDPSLGITVQIRETNNGYPSSSIIASKFISSSSVNVSNTAATATTVTFDTPLYLKANKDYCVVIVPDQFNPSYLLWTAEAGIPDVANTSLITNQNWGGGVLFASSNDKAWTAIQGEDLKFKIYVANFDKTNATIAFENGPYEFLTVSNTSGSFIDQEEVGQKSNTYLSGTFTCNTTSAVVNTTTSQVSTISSGDYVLIVYGNTAVTKTGTVTVGNTTTTNVTGSGTTFSTEYAAGDYILINNNLREIVSIANTTQITIDAPLSASVSANVHKSVTEAFQVSRVNGSNSSSITLKDNPLYLIDGGTTYFGGLQKVVRAKVDRLNADGSIVLSDSTASNSTFLFQAGKTIVGDQSKSTATITSVDNKTVNYTEAHILDLTPPTTRVNLIQRIDSLAGAAANSFMMDGVSNSLQYEGQLKSRSNEITSGSKSFKLYANLTRANTFNSISPIIDTVPATVVTLSNIINNSSANETSRYGNADVKYISKNVVLADGLDAEDIKVFVTAYKPSTSNILVYAKILANDDTTVFEDRDWTLLQQTTETNLYSDSLNENDFIEYQYGFFPTPPSTAIAGVITSSSNTTITGSGTTFSTDLAANDVIKIVNTNTNTNYDIAVVNAVANNTSLTLKSSTSFSSVTASIEKVTQKNAAFKYNKESNIVTYFDKTLGRHSSYKVYAIKVVLLSSSTKFVPILNDVRAIAVSI